MSSPQASERTSDLGDPPVRLVLPGRPSSLAVVRQAVTGMASAVGVPEALLDDVKVAVTEACTNVVLHAYGDGEGPMRIDGWADRDRMVVMVRDEGQGMTARTERRSPGLGLGLRMIATLASDVSISSEAGRGTEVWMTFAIDPDGHRGD